MNTMSTGKRNALAGIIAALSVVILILNNLLPVLAITVACIAGFLLLFCRLECGIKAAVFVYITTAFLSFLLLFDKDVFLMYTILFGLYALIKYNIDSLKRAAVRNVVKLLFGIVLMSLYYIVFLLLWGAPIEVLNLQENSVWLAAIFIAAGTGYMVLYDFVMSRFANLYVWRYRERFLKLFR